MARLVFTENGVQIIRNFSSVRSILPDGRGTRVSKVPDGLLLELLTGNGEERELRIVYPDVSSQEKRRGRTLMAYIGSGALILGWVLRSFLVD